MAKHVADIAPRGMQLDQAARDRWSIIDRPSPP